MSVKLLYCEVRVYSVWILTSTRTCPYQSVNKTFVRCVGVALVCRNIVVGISVTDTFIVFDKHENRKYVTAYTSVSDRP